MGFFLLFPFIPGAQFRPAHVHPIGEHREGFRAQLQGWTFYLARLGPAKGPTFQAFAQHPQAGSIKVEHLDPGMTPVTKHVERSTARILSKTAAHQPRKTVVALAQSQPSTNKKIRRLPLKLIIALRRAGQATPQPKPLPQSC